MKSPFILILSTALFLIGHPQAGAQNDGFLYGSGLEGEWTVSTGTFQLEYNSVMISDLSEIQLNKDRNILYLPSFEMLFTDSTVMIVHSDTSFQMAYTYDENTDRISIDHEKGPLLVQIHHIASEKRMRLVLQEVEDNAILFLENKKKIKGKRPKFK
jgi:hypothetical protein